MTIDRTCTKKATLLVTTAAIGAAALLGGTSSPAGADEPAPRYNLTMAWPVKDDPATFTAIALAESGGNVRAGNIEFEWKVEEGES